MTFEGASERLSERVFEGWSSGMIFIGGLGINGWDFSVRSDRGEVGSGWPKYVGDVGHWILDLWLGLVGWFGPAERPSDSQPSDQTWMVAT